MEDLENRRRAWNGAVYAMVASILITSCSLLAGVLVRETVGSGSWALATQIMVLAGLSVAGGWASVFLIRR